jgi:hypothetical protein
VLEMAKKSLTSAKALHENFSWRKLPTQVA